VAACVEIKNEWADVWSSTLRLGAGPYPPSDSMTPRDWSKQRDKKRDRSVFRKCDESVLIGYMFLMSMISRFTERGNCQKKRKKVIHFRWSKVFWPIMWRFGIIFDESGEGK
jgi:hypothetical protein